MAVAQRPDPRKNLAVALLLAAVAALFFVAIMVKTGLFGQ